MPGPTTEAVNEDLKDLRGDLHRLEVNLTKQIDQVAITIGERVAKLSAEFALFKWLLGLTLVASLSGIISSSYWAGSLASRVAAVEGRLDKVDARLDRLETSLNTRFERLEANIGRLLERGSSAASPGLPKP